MNRFYLLSFLSLNVLNAQQSNAFQLELSNSSWAVRAYSNTNVTENFSMHQIYLLTSVNHPFKHYTPFIYTLNNKTFINEEGFFSYKNNKVNMIFGRHYNPIGPGELSGLFISPVAPSLDQLTINIDNIRNVLFRNSFIRLDNRGVVWNGQNEIAQRWYYLRSIGYNYKDILEINFIDAVVATGFNRGLEWYYLNPLSSLFMERKNQMSWTDGADSSAVLGIGDNDNHFIGGNVSLVLREWKIFGEWLIDEWQLASERRDSLQTVFGIIIGTNYSHHKYSFSVEYSLASPWLYMNRALYGSLELHKFPIGLRSPHSQSIDLGLQINFSENRIISGQIHWEQQGNQTFAGVWDPWGNYVDLFGFTIILPLEWNLNYTNTKGKYFNQFSIYQNWLGTKDTFFMISKDWQFKL